MSEDIKEIKEEAIPAGAEEKQAVPIEESGEKPVVVQHPAERPGRTEYRDASRERPRGRRGGYYDAGDGKDREPGAEQSARIPRFKRKLCTFCQDKHVTIDYKHPEMLERFITDRGKILPRRVTGTCSKHQRIVAREIKRARIIAMLPFVEQ